LGMNPDSCPHARAGFQSTFLAVFSSRQVLIISI
jgi:hypothetical protein